MARLLLWGSGTVRTFRAHWALHELGIDYDLKPIGSRTGETQTAEFLTLNPKGKIPVLVDAALTITESGAIVRYLYQAYANEPLRDLEYETRYNEWQTYILMELDAHTLYVMRRHGDLANLYGEAPAAMVAARDGFVRQVAAAHTRLAQSPYLLGSQFSGVDLLLTTCLDWAHAYRVPLTPRLDEWRRRQHERPAYQAARRSNSG
ncbi:MAG: glutathione S-transferase family protein [Gammaproteobacteria bacterium]|nr:glutathione S-transferase family protein [Gammaproteobacteria bacterium]